MDRMVANGFHGGEYAGGCEVRVTIPWVLGAMAF